MARTSAMVSDAFRRLSARSDGVASLAIRFGRFVIVGGLSTFIQYAILIALVEGLRTNATLASSIGFVVSAVLNYRVNYSFTFGSDVPHRVAAPRFVVTAMAGLALNTSVMFVLSEIWSMQYVLAQIVATAATLAWNFAVNYVWSFKPGKGQHG